MRRALAGLALAASFAAGCGGEGAVSAVERGEELASSPSLSGSSFNALACTSCHAVRDGDPRLLPGHPLPGAARRPSFWGGYSPDLKSAVDACLVWFMKGDPLDPASDDARALYEYLVSLEGPADALPLTVVRTVEEAPPRGDPARGAKVHELACASCHGAASSGAGRLVEAAPVLPEQAREEALDAFPTYDPAVVFAEKVRHGQFFGVGGNMPFYSLEALSDADLGALLAFYGL